MKTFRKTAPAMYRKNTEKFQHGISDEVCELMNILYHSMKGYEKTGLYAVDAEEAGDNELFIFFNQIHNENLNRAKRAQELLATRISMVDTQKISVKPKDPDSLI